jgi:hypothetical protein
MFASNPTVYRPAQSSVWRPILSLSRCAVSMVLLLGMLALSVDAGGQQSLNLQQSPAETQAPRAPQDQKSPPPPAPSVPPAIAEQVVQNPNAPCVQPPPPVTWRDYKGPFAKTVAVFAQRLERRSVGPGAQPHPHYKPGVLLCTLETKDKFWLFVRDSTDPVAFINATWNAGVSQVQDTQPTFGRGFNGYLDRFGGKMAGQTSSNFFKDFVYPTVFEEDPRYYRLGAGSTKRRIFHAMSHVVIAHNENGNRMFNFSEWLGDATVTVLSNTYLPDNRRGVAPVAESMASGMTYDMGYDILREFWPEIAKTFHLPFRDQSESPVTTIPPQAH